MVDRFKIFSERLKAERIACGYTQAQIATLLNITQPVYNRYEKGGTKQGREPDFHVLCELSKILQVSTDFLLGLED